MRSFGIKYLMYGLNLMVCIMFKMIVFFFFFFFLYNIAVHPVYERVGILLIR